MNRREAGSDKSFAIGEREFIAIATIRVLREGGS